MGLVHKLAIMLAAFLVWSPSLNASELISKPLIIGESWVVNSSILKEKRVINVYRLPGIADDVALPVIYMLDGGLTEDFLHIAGLLQVGAENGTTRAFILVGIENTDRRRDLTGPTDIEKDLSIAQNVGGSKAFREFIRYELMPQVEKRYRNTSEKAIIGESLAGLFVVETLIQTPDMFDTYIAIDPSLWWNGAKLLSQRDINALNLKNEKNLYVGSSKDGQSFIDRKKLFASFGKIGNLNFHYEDWLSETHATIYHPAALKAFRVMFSTISSPFLEQSGIERTKVRSEARINAFRTPRKTSAEMGTAE